ncbi:metallophosphatase domain-containing protein [Edaphobacter modestus]|uniref:Icc-related predicted phosphoesterase n=1 Tax=Edaphobacter modestus TaxID=388466 RepID=A0A4Q7YVG6_9BACT|nr:metallophosphatase domain-containing protein [Edaphobacter modestus]RZU41344.1 Icc-related predicted phosphoesterase [Edaphobacter modestus]
MAKTSAIRIVCISDTHGQHRKLKVSAGDVLIHAGDFMLSGRRLEEIVDFDDWLETLPHRHKIVVAGNHDLLFEAYPELAQARLKNARYLENAGAEVLGLRIWGSPIQPTFHNWAFNVDRGAAIRRYWKKIPANTDVLITHGPPFETLDKANILGSHLGCEELAKVVSKIKPRLHVFGHIHGGYGKEAADGSTTFVNCAVVDERYVLAHAPIVVDLPNSQRPFRT